MTGWKNVPLVFLALCAIGVAASASAQTRSTVTGVVADSTGGVLPGVTLILESPDLVGGAQTTTTNDRGTYRFFELPPGTYSLSASLAGFQGTRRTGVRLLFGTTTTLDLTLGTGSATESLTVEGKTPAVDTTTAATTSKVDADLLQAVPILTDPRNGFQLNAMSPGINSRSAFGGAVDANELLFDGAPTTLPERQGTNAAVINANWMEEIQIVGLGAGAEYGEFSGTVTNFVTRSGSNDFRGLVDYRQVPGSWIGSNVGSLSPALQTRFTPAKVLKQWDTNAQIGGPIKRDTLFFFSGVQYMYQKSQPAGAPATGDLKQWRAIGKLTWAASKSVKVDGTVQKNHTQSHGSPTSTQTADVGFNTDEPNLVWTARATWTPGPKTMVVFRTGGLDYFQTVDPKRGRTGPPSHLDAITGIRSANGNQYSDLDQTRFNLEATVTRYADNVLGLHHELKFGAGFNHRSYYSLTGIPSGLDFQDRNGVPTQVTIWPGDVKNITGNQTTLFLQDGWKLNEHLTIEPGLRVTLNRGATPTGGDVFSTNPISLRFGVAWDVTKSHKTVVRAHYGRYHEAFGTIEYEFTDTATQTTRITASVLPNGQYQELSRFVPAGNQNVDPNIKQAYMDQYLIGVEHELFADFSVTAQYIQREYKDLFNWIDTKSIYVPAQMRDPGPNGTVGNADDGDLITVYNLTNPGQESRLFTNIGSRRYRGFQLVLQKRFSKNWQMLAGYTRSKAEGSVNNNGQDNYGGQNAALNPFINPNNATNATGRNTLDFPNELVLRGSYHFTVLRGFNVGAVYRYLNGVALSRTAVFRLTQGNTTVRVEPRGTLPTDSTNQLDIRFDKTFPLGKKSRQFSVYVDIFNVNNQGAGTNYTEASGGTFGVPTAWSAARTYLLSGRFTF